MGDNMSKFMIIGIILLVIGLIGIGLYIYLLYGVEQKQEELKEQSGPWRMSVKPKPIVHYIGISGIGLFVLGIIFFVVGAIKKGRAIENKDIENEIKMICPECLGSLVADKTVSPTIFICCDCGKRIR